MQRKEGEKSNFGLFLAKGQILWVVWRKRVLKAVGICSRIARSSRSSPKTKKSRFFRSGVGRTVGLLSVINANVEGINDIK
jgi:hypothetical protein